MKFSHSFIGRRKAGFTLIELLVVIAIIGILAAVVLASLNSARAKARDVKRIASLKQVQTALEFYRNDNGGYPFGNYNSESSWTSSLTTALVNPGYISTMPLDPNGFSIFRFYSNYGGYNCNGRPWSDYEYVLTFGLEKTNTALMITNWGAEGGTQYCLPGSLK
ncbi:prepilin-type N-terminal cleavage/methylation domain-containing protein [Patescibacteria group bacterium]|nr:prepilin-type N-terminal cleavage/methylation domain-containing protein [Patescibacteria group bacterium]